MLTAILTAGALGTPFHRDEVPFEVVARDHFDALAVSPQTGAPTRAPLDLHLDVEGDGADADLSGAFAWLAQHAGVRVVRDPAGAPLFLTQGDLSATSGRATLGATVSSGIAAEVGDGRIKDCVVAHEILHLLGLGHVEDPDNIMFPHCTPGMLERAKLEPWQLVKIESLDGLQATTPHGVEQWVTRG
ncbi:MAG: Matrixin [Thermoplasmata archaeon]|jgi:hypothetical protein|nr:Matrixin [Thermoplasmata archaeon]